MRADRSVNVASAARRSAMIFCLLFAAQGCREVPTTVSGTITLDGRPLAVASDARGTVVFHPVGGQGTLATGLLDSTGHFNLAIGGSRVIAPGRYQVAVAVVRLLPKLPDAEQATELITPTKYAAVHESGLKAEVVPGENLLSFNLVTSATEEDSSAAELPAEPKETGRSESAAPLTAEQQAFGRTVPADR